MQALWKGKGHKLTFGNYVIESELGRGGMGVVLKARHKRMQRHVAIKVLPTAMVKDTDAIARFQREITTAANLSSMNQVALSVFKADTTVKRGIKTKRKKAGWDETYLNHILNITAISIVRSPSGVGHRWNYGMRCRRSCCFTKELVELVAFAVRRVTEICGGAM